jgi:transposase InsO family protein
MDASFCVEASEKALAKHGTPGIFNTDQGSQFTSESFTSVLIASKISISMDGKGAWSDNVFVERIWKSVKYEEVCLHAYDSVGVARASLGRYLNHYNRLRPHSVSTIPSSVTVGTPPPPAIAISVSSTNITVRQSDNDHRLFHRGSVFGRGESPRIR